MERGKSGEKSPKPTSVKHGGARVIVWVRVAATGTATVSLTIDDLIVDRDNRMNAEVRRSIQYLQI